MIIVNTKQEVFELVEKNSMVLLYFSSENCSTCMALKPKIQQLLTKYPKVISGEIEGRVLSKFAADFNVFSPPIIILYVDGKETIREGRYASIEELEEKIKRYYEMIF